MIPKNKEIVNMQRLYSQKKTRLDTLSSVGSPLYNLKVFFTKYKFLNLLVLPGLIYFIVFRYLPFYGIVIAFKNYNGMGGVAGIINSPWIGFSNFIKFFSGEYFLRLLGNSLIISAYELVFGFPLPIILALILNEIYNQRFKRIVQTVTYLPHFLSWVVIAGLIITLLAKDGPVNEILYFLGLKKIGFLTSTKFFRGVIVSSQIWQSLGWNSILFLAAIASIPSEMYESAIVEGASRWQRAIYITLPSMFFVITIMLILFIGSSIDSNFDQIVNLYSPAVYSVGDVFDTFVFRRGIQGSEFSYSATVGLFKSVANFILVYGSNKLAKQFGQEGIW